MGRVLKEGADLMKNTNSGNVRIDFAPEDLMDLNPEEEKALLEKRQKEIEEYDKTCKEIDDRQMRGVCVYCGGSFEGLFVKKCRLCGKKKNYTKNDPIGSLHL